MEKTATNFDTLINLFYVHNSVEITREIVSSIGRHNSLDKIYTFLSDEIFIKHFMEIIYQMYRTCLYKSAIDKRFFILGEKALSFYNNEVMLKMKEFYEYKKSKIKGEIIRDITKPTLL